jgi:hypothetical protein
LRRLGVILVHGEWYQDAVHLLAKELVVALVLSEVKSCKHKAKSLPLSFAYGVDFILFFLAFWSKHG